MSRTSRRLLGPWWAQALLATAYIGTGTLGLAAAVVHGNVTLIWPPTGIATAAILLFGFRVWPAIAFASFVTTFATGAPVAFALVTAVSNPLQAVAARILLGRAGTFDPSLRRVSDVVLFALLGAVVSPVASATLGTAGLCLTGMAPWTSYPAAWALWWIGDGMGVLLVAPLILTWFAGHSTDRARRGIEVAILLLCLLVVGTSIYGGLVAPAVARPLSYASFPLVIWAAVRFGPRGAANAIVILATAAIWGVAQGHGPFADGGLAANLLNLHGFLGMLAIVGLVVAAARDERAQSQAAVQAAHDVLERRIEERTAALRAAKEEAEAANRAKSSFLANMSHELRTPLNAVIGFAELIKDARRGPLDVRYRDYGSHIQVAGLHLLGIIGDVLDLSKIEASGLVLHEERVAMTQLLDDCRHLVSERAETSGITLTEDVPADLPFILADGQRLKQIVLNLLSNAIKFTPSGGRITIAVRTSEEGITIVVADTGIGMEADEIPLALAPFQQVDYALNRRYEGTGLGLPLAKTLTELHGGALRIESEPGAGTTVTIQLPAWRLAECEA